MSDTNWIAPVVTLVTNAGFGGLVYYLITRFIPDMQKSHKEERDTDRKHYEERLDDRDKKIEKMVEDFTEQIKKSNELMVDTQVILARVVERLDDYESE